MSAVKSIIVDLDSTVVNMMAPLISKYNTKFNDDLKIEDVKGWDLDKYAKHGKAIFDVMGEPSFFRDLQPFPGAIESVKELIDAGKEVLIVTAVDYNFPDSMKGKAGWMMEHMPFIDKRHYMTVGDKWRIKADAIVDDAPRNAIDYRKHHPNAKIAGIAFPYNVNVKEFNLLAPSYDYPDLAWESITQYLLDV